MIRFVRSGVDWIQGKLSFRDWDGYFQFETNQGLGRVAVVASTLGVLLGYHALGAFLIGLHLFDQVHFPLLDTYLGEKRIILVFQWFVYVIAMCIFHLAEFFTTAIYNPTVLTAESFLVDHSTAYTIAILTSALEFWTRFALFPWWNSPFLAAIGIVIVQLSQVIRSAAMKTCGESFNHRIQTKKKNNHVLITHGIYKYLRHPSYVGFFYWSVGTQVLLNNMLCVVFFAIASCMFFRRRIPYEEQSLHLYFPDDYAKYVRRTLIGIPFIPEFDPSKLD